MYDVCVTTGPEAHPPQPANTVAVSPGPLLIENTGRVSTVTIYSTCQTHVICLLLHIVSSSNRAFPESPHHDSWYLIVLRLFGAVHILLAMWMVVEYFLNNFPHFRIHVFAM